MLASQHSELLYFPFRHRGYVARGKVERCHSLGLVQAGVVLIEVRII